MLVAGTVPLRQVAIPSAHLAPRPLGTIRPRTTEALGIHFSAARNFGPEAMSDGAVGCFHTVQVSRDIGSHNEARELPGQKIQGSERNHEQQENRNDADKNVCNYEPVSQTP